jgi:hypothetical protein
VWCITRETIYLNPAEKTATFKNEGTRRGILRAADKIAQNIHAGFSLWVAFDLEVDTRAAAGTAIWRDLCLLKLSKEFRSVRTAMHEHVTCKFFLGSCQWAIGGTAFHEA